MEANNVKEIIRRELPGIIRTDPDFRDFVLSLTRGEYADKPSTESRFDQIMARLERDSAEDRRKWDENQRKWDENQRKWDENQRKWDEFIAEDRRKWDENQRKWDEFIAEDRRKWDESRAESEQKWKQNAIEHERMFRRIDSGISALGARWGIQSETSFRNGLKAILEQSFDVEVVNYLDYDEEGKVFGRPDQVEMDIIIKNGTLILCEIKSSMSRSDMYVFGRKVEFYEEKHTRKADRRLVISPMVEEKAIAVAQKLGIEVYSHGDEVTGL
jgi:hypothetical protein